MFFINESRLHGRNQKALPNEKKIFHITYISLLNVFYLGNNCWQILFKLLLLLFQWQGLFYYKYIYSYNDFLLLLFLPFLALIIIFICSTIIIYKKKKKSNLYFCKICNILNITQLIYFSFKNINRT